MKITHKIGIILICLVSAGAFAVSDTTQKKEYRHHWWQIWKSDKKAKPTAVKRQSWSTIVDDIVALELQEEQKGKPFTGHLELDQKIDLLKNGLKKIGADLKKLEKSQRAFDASADDVDVMGM